MYVCKEHFFYGKTKSEVIKRLERLAQIVCKRETHDKKCTEAQTTKKAIIIAYLFH